MEDKEYLEFLLENYRELRSKIILARMDFEHNAIDDAKSIGEDLVVMISGDADTHPLPTLAGKTEKLRVVNQSKRAEKRQIIDNMEYELDRLENAINLLGDPYKKMMIKRFLQGLTGRTIAITLNFSESSVSRYLSKGKQLLMQMW